MRYLTLRRSLALGVTLLSLACIVAACSGAAAQVQPTPVTIVGATPVLQPTLVPTPTPILPTPTPVPPAPQPQQGPIILDLQPASMSLVGHLDCPISNKTFFCKARVLSRASNPGNLNWTAFTNVPGHITFSPAGGVLAPGQSVIVMIAVPMSSCTHGLFFFRGPSNTHTITWAC